MNSLPKTVTRQRRGCDLNPGPSAPESSTLTTRLPSHPVMTVAYHLPCRCSSVRVAEHKILMTRSDDVQWTCIANILVTNRISV